ncbi:MULTISPECIES: FliH/SctL family protein [unclassified Paenibacillus]|uniref:FliH/SctL family protein n=1 Tax=Paenibacillus sp. RUD330 TaxID=2023772 RepID=UPI000953E240|nr:MULTISPECIES: FliH/SctL family protein [unclassified Paenibacillus]ASS65718.1 flagellar assembly protein FliH [Paenibacillus sp. RUD330]SIQ26407.1 flagellar assembly protein FliH [Paenibacillus sp. RU4X]SIQ48305.1 flagellar assembly protein FliH [Paenibacillus sp. RU4T]
MSNLFKSSQVVPQEQHQRLERFYRKPAAASDADTAPDGFGEQAYRGELRPDAATEALRSQILGDAQSVAEDTLADAAKQAQELIEQARQEAEDWWHARRADDERIAEEARLAGYGEGFSQGSREAEAALRKEWEQRIEESSSILEASFRMKEQIIQEAEPFLVELSCAIAEKLVGKQLDLEPDIAIDLIRNMLSRRRENGSIVLCVSPAQLSSVLAARDELELSIDSQAELQILPDASVKDHGCVIRTAFGSIDARIDTQLSEIKRELMGIASQREGQEAPAS